MAEHLGFIGMGVMGAPMAARLRAAGYPLQVWNRSPDKTAPLVAKGATAAATPAAVMAASEVVLLCVFDAAAVEEVAFGAGGLASAGRSPGKLVIDHSSITPAATRAIAARLERETGARWIDAPVTGGVPGAEAGTLAIMAGGAAADVERVRPILAHLSQRLTHMGPTGAGQLTKLCNQMMVGGTMALIAEMLQLAAAGGLDIDRLPECMGGGYGDSTILQNFARPMAKGAVASGNLVTTLLKDLGSACAQGQESEVAMPLTALAAQLYRTLYAQHHGAHDGMGILRLYREAPLAR